MYNLDNPEVCRMVEAEIRKLLGTLKDQVDIETVSAYLMLLLKQQYEDTDALRESVKQAMNIFFAEDTDRIVDALFDFLESMNDAEDQHVDTGSESSQEEEEKSGAEDDSSISDLETDKVNEEKEENSKEAVSTQVGSLVRNELKVSNTSTQPSQRPRSKFAKRREAILSEAMQIFKEIMSPNTSPLQKARLNFRLLTINKTPFRCLVVRNIPSNHLNVASIAKHFQYYGDITNITVQEQSNSAIVQFEHSESAYAAMRSHSAVFKNRFVIVEAFYDPNDPSTFEVKTGKRRKTAVKEDPMKLVEDRRNIRLQAISTIRSSIGKRIDLLKKYALVAKTVKESEISKFRKSLDSVLFSLYEDTNKLYESLKTSGVKETENSDPETEVKQVLFSVLPLFENTFVYSSLKGEVTIQVISIFQRQYQLIQKSKRRPNAPNLYTSKRGKRASSYYQIDNRPKTLQLLDLPEGTTQDDVAVALKGFFGVKSIQMEGRKALISFEEVWQTKKPMKTGLMIRRQLLHPTLVQNVQQ